MKPSKLGNRMICKFESFIKLTRPNNLTSSPSNSVKLIINWLLNIRQLKIYIESGYLLSRCGKEGVISE